MIAPGAADLRAARGAATKDYRAYVEERRRSTAREDQARRDQMYLKPLA